MGSSRSTRHDGYARDVLSVERNAVSEIRSVLPAEACALVDWDAGLVLQPGSFVTADLKSRYSDLLYRAQIAGREAFIYVLIEHQSSTDPLMAMRMLEYTVCIWREYRKQRREADLPVEWLPVVIPLVVHCSPGGRVWDAPMDVADLLDIDAGAREVLGPYLPRMRFFLDDISAVQLEQLRARELTAATRMLLVLLKIAPRNRHLDVDLVEWVEDLLALEVEAEDPLTELQVVVRYIIGVSETPEEDLVRVLEQYLGPRGKEALVTTEERIEARGEAKGEARGAAQARAEMLVELLTVKFGPLPAAVVLRVQGAGAEQVRGWSTRVLTATTLDEVFD